jgi:hypothetical protein
VPKDLWVMMCGLKRVKLSMAAGEGASSLAQSFYREDSSLNTQALIFALWDHRDQPNIIELCGNVFRSVVSLNSSSPSCLVNMSRKEKYLTILNISYPKLLIC